MTGAGSTTHKYHKITFTTRSYFTYHAFILLVPRTFKPQLRVGSGRYQEASMRTWIRYLYPPRQRACTCPASSPPANSNCATRARDGACVCPGRARLTQKTSARPTVPSTHVPAQFATTTPLYPWRPGCAFPSCPAPPAPAAGRERADHKTTSVDRCRGNRHLCRAAPACPRARPRPAPAAPECHPRHDPARLVDVG